MSEGKAMGQLEGKVALITGAAAGMGRAAARLFAREGARVVVVDREIAGAEEVAHEITAGSGQAIALKADVSRAGDCERMIADTARIFGELDIVYNNAGIVLMSPLHETSEDEWNRILSVNLNGVFFSCKYALPELMKKGGAILNTASVAAMDARPWSGAYCASKAGVVMLTKTIAMDYARYKIRANCLCPGGVATSMAAEFAASASAETQARMARWMAENLPMGRTGEPEELARAALFLCSDAASYINGSTLVVDGGEITGHMLPFANM